MPLTIMVYYGKYEKSLMPRKIIIFAATGPAAAIGHEKHGRDGRNDHNTPSCGTPTGCALTAALCAVDHAAPGPQP